MRTRDVMNVPALLVAIGGPAAGITMWYGVDLATGRPGLALGLGAAVIYVASRVTRALSSGCSFTDGAADTCATLVVVGAPYSLLVLVGVPAIVALPVGIAVGLPLGSLVARLGSVLGERRRNEDRNVEGEAMTKSVITRLFVGGIVAVFAGLVLAAVAIVGAFANGVFVVDGSDVTGVHWSPFAWTMVGLMVVAILGMIAGAIAGLVAWIGALLNTVQLEDKTWFVVLLVLGLLSFGLVAMLAYVIAGPDATRREVATIAHAAG
jgi:hypothetical protein